jgi:hypothetical protein
MSQTEDQAGSPATTSPAEDVGADTQRRFRHQACYAAILSLGLLDIGGPLEELYCEHHDDVVLRLSSGLFRAIQVKTRMVGRVPFKAGDAEIVSALRKFAFLERNYPGQFDGYILAANVGFWHEKKNGSNLQHLLDGIKAGSLGVAAGLLKKIAETKPTVAVTVVAVALQKVTLTETPGLDDVESRLREQLAQISEFRGRRYDELKVASDALRECIFKASSLSGLSALPEYLVLCSDSPETVLEQHVIQSKRISKEIVREVLNHGLSSITLLRTHQLVPISELPTGMTRMEIKMAAGGLTVSEIEHLKDLKYSAESLLQEWLYRYGPDRAQDYYEHFRVVVRDECLAAQQTSEQAEGLYGNRMLSELRKNLAQRAATQAGEVPEHRREHLLGVAGILTEDCKVWWSTEFRLPEGHV